MIHQIKSFFNIIFNRLTITVILILIQCGWFAVLLLRFAAYASWISFVFTVGAAVMALFIIWRDDNPAYKIGWILLICLFPILGATMYVFFGNKRPSKGLKKKMDITYEKHKDDLCQTDDLDENLSTRLRDTVHYLSNKGLFPAWTNTKTEYYDIGEKAYEDILSDLKKAEHFIFIEYFILSDGLMWNGILEILREKADAGVDVRIIYDDFGSMKTLPKHFNRKMKNYGIKTLAFNSVKPIVSMVYNNRDHRKILIIDGYIGYSGGYNIADEYINEKVRFGHWKDTGTKLTGEGVWNYTVMFLNMWNSFIETDADYQAFRPHAWHPGDFESDGVVQPYSDSPLDGESVGENVYLEILSQAEDYVYIFTPYLIIDNEMKTSLVLAAKRGVDVRIVTPGIPDKKMIYRLTRSYYRPLQEAGVKIYEYTPGFIHAKSYISDDRIGVVGTINMDYRSLYLHFECGTLMIGSSALNKLKQDCVATIGRSTEIGYNKFKRGFFGTLFDALLRVISPLL